VQNTIYLGDHALAVLDVADNKEFMVKLQPGTHDGLRQGGLRAGSFTPGDDVFITFRPEDCLALDPI
jgi:putative spermidine/putrescine transport system ATP-binding protein